MSGMALAARVRYVPLGGGAGASRPRRRDGEYAARRAVFLQSYRFSVDDDDDDRQGDGEGRRGRRLARRLREAVARARWCVGAGLARAWRGWIRPRAGPLLAGCFGTAHRHEYYLHGYA